MRIFCARRRFNNPFTTNTHDPVTCVRIDPNWYKLCLMSWVYLIVAILLEVSGTTCMKLSQGLTKLGPSVLVFVFYGCSLVGLTLALKKLQVSVAYAVWSGVGTAVVAVIGVVWFKEPMTAVKMVCLTMIIAGVVGLYLLGGYSPASGAG